MNINDIYPRRYAPLLDLEGRAMTVTITGVKAERTRQPGSGSKEIFVLFFSETPRAVLLTPNLAAQIAKATGRDDTDQWTGQRITLYPEVIKVAGQPRTVIRAKAAA